MEMSQIAKDCLQRIDNERQALRTFRANDGKSLGYFCKHFPPAIGAGLGMWPVRILCDDDNSSWITGERLLRPDVCPIVKSFIGGLAGKSGMYAEIDTWLGLYTCDQMRRGLHYAAIELGASVYPVHLPATRSPEAEDYYISQLQRFITDAERHYNLRFEHDLAYQWQLDYIAACNIIYNAVMNKHLSPTTIHYMLSLLHICSPKGLADFIKGTINAYPPYQSDVSLIVIGGPISLHDIVLLEELEKARAFVFPLNCTGLDIVEGAQPPTGSDGIIEGISRSAFNSPRCARTRPNKPVYDRIETCLSQSEASGIIIKNLRTCDYWYADRIRIRNMFNVPVLYLDTDYSQGGEHRLKSRISAFLETL